MNVRVDASGGRFDVEVMVGEVQVGEITLVVDQGRELSLRYWCNYAAPYSRQRQAAVEACARIEPGFMRRALHTVIEKVVVGDLTDQAPFSLVCSPDCTRDRRMVREPALMDYYRSLGFVDVYHHSSSQRIYGKMRAATIRRVLDRLL